MFITRKAEFSASHVCRLPHLTDQQNEEIYGMDANPNGHGHNYVIEVTLEGEPDPASGMLLDLKDLKKLLDDEVIEPMDHRFLNKEVTPFEHVVPTAENVAREIWQRLHPHFAAGAAQLHRVRLWETPDLYVDVTRPVGSLTW